MIQIDIIRDETNKITKFTMSGHANAGPYGYDLVCAGASAVSIGAVNAIYELCKVELDVAMEEEGGFLQCVIPRAVEGKSLENVQFLLEAMLVSLQSIASEYSEHIQIND